MKTIALLLFCALSGLSANAKPGVQLNFDFFYDTLAPYGEWSSVGDYGYVWHPADVDEDWTPYSDGYWAYTDAGWTWVSYEEWGGIPYHYGRWVRVEDYGWCWVPDYEWGPAWVSWRQSDDYVGWAPLPPEAHWRRNTGFGIWVDTEYDIGPGSFRFCHSRDFGAPFLLPILLPRTRNIGFIEQTINITNITYRSDRGCAFNGGPDYRRLSELSARPLPALKLVRHAEDIFTQGSRGNVFRNAPRGNTLVVSAPPVAPRLPETPGKQPPIARSFTTAKIDHGWSGTAHDPAHERIRAHFKQQTDGASPQTSPALPFLPGLVAAVPKKADPKAKIFSGFPGAGARGAQPAIATKGGEPPVPFLPPAITPDPRTERHGKTPTKIGDISRPAQPAIIALPSDPKNAPSPPALLTEPRSEKFGKKPFKIADIPQPSVLPPAAAPKIAPATPISSNPQPPQPIIKAPAPTLPAEPRGEKFGKRPSRLPENSQPALVPPTAPRIAAPNPAPAPQPLSKIAAPSPVRPRDDSAARGAREQAESAARRRDAESAAHAADKQRRDAAAVENAHRLADAQRTARDQARVNDGQRAAEAQRLQNEMSARRTADAARRQAVAPRASAPIAAPPPQRAPIQLPPPQVRSIPAAPPIQLPPSQARPNPASIPAPVAPGDPRRFRGRDEDGKR